MKKRMLAGLLLVVLLLLAAVVYLTAPAVVLVPPNSVAYIVAKNDTAVIVPPNSTAIIVPVLPVTPGVPQVIFIGITTVSPKDLAKYQFISNNIVVTFTEAMDPATVNQNTFMVKGPNNVEIKGIITSDKTKKVWTFNPIDNLVSYTVYNVTVTTGAKGVSGNSLEKDFLWSFTTNPIFASGSPGSPSGPSPPAPPVLTTIILSPASANLAVGSIQQLTVASLDQFGSPIAASITYNTSNSSVATVNASGAVTAVAIGNATITATSGAISDTSVIIVAAAACPAVAVNLGTAGDFAILSKTGIDAAIGTEQIVGDIGVSPIDHTAITGFALIGVPASDTFLTSALVTGKIYAANLFPPTPAKMTAAVSDMETAYTTAGGLAVCVLDVGAGHIGGLTLVPGVYKWGSDVDIRVADGDLTLTGSATDVWVFIITGKLDVASARQVNLIGGALAKNVYWVVADTTTLGSTSIFNGNILDKTNIALLTGATLNGRALAQTAVTLQANAVTTPG
jgi:hypothetical protein